MQDHSDILTLKKGYIAKLKELEAAHKEYPILAEAMADAERVYLVSKSTAILDLKDQKQSATLIPAIAKGMAADERFNFKVAESIFHACRENLKRLHANLEAYRSLLSTAKSEINLR